MFTPRCGAGAAHAPRLSLAGGVAPRLRSRRSPSCRMLHFHEVSILIGPRRCAPCKLRVAILPGRQMRRPREGHWSGAWGTLVCLLLRSRRRGWPGELPGLAPGSPVIRVCSRRRCLVRFEGKGEGRSDVPGRALSEPLILRHEHLAALCWCSWILTAIGSGQRVSYRAGRSVGERHPSH